MKKTNKQQNKQKPQQQKKKGKGKKEWQRIIFYLDCEVLKLPVFNINVPVFQGHDYNSSAIYGYQ